MSYALYSVFQVEVARVDDQRLINRYMLIEHCFATTPGNILLSMIEAYLRLTLISPQKSIFAPH
jgi:hypothetical protein